MVNKKKCLMFFVNTLVVKYQYLQKKNSTTR